MRTQHLLVAILVVAILILLVVTGILDLHVGQR